MADQVNLTVTAGHLKGQTFTFDSRTTCIIGRTKDCQPQIPDDENHRTISRYHCLLDINPPDIRVRDFGSLNGTFVNGKKIGQRQAHQTPEEGAKLKFPQYDLKTGDEIQLSDTVFQVSIQVDPELENTIPSPHLSPQVNRWEMLENLLQKAEAGESNLGVMADYTLIKELGRGGFSLVYLARHKRTGEEVALKVMLPRIAANPRAINLFLREAENTKALQHPHVVQ